MSDNQEDYPYLGQYVREKIIPAGQSVTAAAQLLGVGRPALSNFLNGKARLSARMAHRLEKVFGADSQRLLEMQALLDARLDKSNETSMVTGTFAPSLIRIRAQQIEIWAKQIEARSRLAVLLRILIHSTGRDLVSVDFPGYDNAECHGPDGQVEAKASTPWIPEGKSIWEFGTSKNPKKKANADYKTRVKSASQTTSFIFVTPHPWRAKGQWAAEKAELGHWRAVRAFDASDLEQWIEQSASAQIWLAQELDRPVAGYRVLDQCWRIWAHACEPRLLPCLFKAATETHARTIERWLKDPSKALEITADSVKEGLAFLYCFLHAPSKAMWSDRTVVFDAPAALQHISSFPAVPLIAVVADPEVEKQLPLLPQGVRTIVVRSRNAIESKFSVSPYRIGLDRLNTHDFTEALRAMGLQDDRIGRLVRETARSLTILRRRLSTNSAIRCPDWAGEQDKAIPLIPMALIGAWKGNSEADREVLKHLSDVEAYETVESNLQDLLRLNDVPVWRAGAYRGVLSKVDALLAVSAYIVPSHLTRFFSLAENILSEENPALQLPAAEQWAAELYGKVRSHSEALRKGVCETLVLLATHGMIFDEISEQDNTGRQVADVVRKVLTLETWENLAALDRDLPYLAEAAPEIFLDFVEQDLRHEQSLILRLLKPLDSSILNPPKRFGLLWALERLAWHPDYLPRTVRILAQLSAVDLTDNWGAKPYETLRLILHAKMPQTAALIEDRKRALGILTDEYPDVGWELCLQQFALIQDVVPNQRPLWRDDAAGAEHEVAREESKQFITLALDRALAWPEYDAEKLGELVARVRYLSPENRKTVWQRVWQRIGQWSLTASDRDKAALLDRIRRCRAWTPDDLPVPRTVTEQLTPLDPVVRHAWLFASSAVELATDESLSYRIRTQRIPEKRRAALQEVWSTHGFEGVRRWIQQSQVAAQNVGWTIYSVIADADLFDAFVLPCLKVAAGDEGLHFRLCLQKTLWRPDAAVRRCYVVQAEQVCTQAERLALLLSLPFRAETWRLLERQPKDVRQSYWAKVRPYLPVENPDESNELIDGFLEAGRSLCALRAVGSDWSEVETGRLKRLLEAIGTSHPQDAGIADMDNHWLSLALDELEKRTDVTVEERAVLEFANILRWRLPDECRVRFLEEQVGRDPDLFAQLIRWAYGKETNEFVSKSARTALNVIQLTPGTGTNGEISGQDLNVWINRVRTRCQHDDLSWRGDQKIGELLSRAPTEQDGLRPCRPVCEALEAIDSKDAMAGFTIGLNNQRGAHIIDAGRAERALAETYRSIAQQLAYEFPFVARIMNCVADSYVSESRLWHTLEQERNILAHD